MNAHFNSKPEAGVVPIARDRTPVGRRSLGRSRKNDNIDKKTGYQLSKQEEEESYENYLKIQIRPRLPTDLTLYAHKINLTLASKC